MFSSPRPAPVPSLMHAAFIRGLGPPASIEYGPLQVPNPGPGEVLLRMEAVAVNHVDTLVRSGAYETTVDFPFIVGRDVVGTVVAGGAGTGGWTAGDRVWCNSLGHAGRQGSFSQYVCAPAERVYRLPEGTVAVNAAAVLHGAATAYLGLVREAHVGSGDTVLILGAGGAVGSAAVQLAVGLGARVLAVASGQDAEWVLGLGAQSVWDYRDPGLQGNLAAALGDGATVVWDCSGSMAIDRLSALTGMGGRIVHTAGIHGHQDIDTGALYRRDISLHGFAISNAAVSDLQAAANHINSMFAGKGIQNRIGRTLPLSSTAEAHRLLEGSVHHRIGGKIVLVPDP